MPDGLSSKTETILRVDAVFPAAMLVARIHALYGLLGLAPFAVTFSGLSPFGFEPTKNPPVRLDPRLKRAMYPKQVTS
jgi:hypothetical protein